MNRTSLLLLAAATMRVAPICAQNPPPPPPIQSPEVQSDHRVTFRFRDPNAKEVILTREGGQRVPMQKDDQGIWTVTTDPLVPDFYGYSFIADGVTLIDPANHLMKPNLLNPQSVVHVRGPASVPWEIGNVPHGSLHRHFYRSGVVGDDRDFYVYTPPGYIGSASTAYPVLYLLHGSAMTRAGGPRWGKPM